MPIIPPNPQERKYREMMNEMFFSTLDTNKNDQLDANDRIDKAILQELGIVDANDQETGKTISKASFIDYFSIIPDKIRNLMAKKAEQPQDSVPKKESLFDKIKEAFKSSETYEA